MTVFIAVFKALILQELLRCIISENIGQFSNIHMLFFGAIFRELYLSYLPISRNKRLHVISPVSSQI